MSDQYQLTVPLDDTAAFFRATLISGIAADTDLAPGGRGLVIHETDGSRIASAMIWGFPLHPSRAALARHPKAKPKPVNKAKGLTRHFWKDFAAQPLHRCLIPVSRFVEGPSSKSRESRTWFSLPDAPLCAWAGLWTDSEEWGPVYASVMTEACRAIAPVHDRMPVILRAEEWDRWMHGTLDDVLDLQRTYGGPVRSEIEANA
jgi:putative SOS response-associated peptidase YedK